MFCLRFIYLCFLFIECFACMCVHAPCACSMPGSQKRAPYPLKLGLQLWASQWLGKEPISSGGVVGVLNHWVILPSYHINKISSKVLGMTHQTDGGPGLKSATCGLKKEYQFGQWFHMNMPSKMLREANDRFLDTVQKTKKNTEKWRRAVIYIPVTCPNLGYHTWRISSLRRKGNGNQLCNTYPKYLPWWS